jgi:hypothetical protein
LWRGIDASNGFFEHFNQNIWDHGNESCLYECFPIAAWVAISSKIIFLMERGHMKKIFIFAAVAVFAMQIARAQEYAYRPNLDIDLFLKSPDMTVDSLPPPPPRKLLPDNIHFVERKLWGESGLFRTMGLAAPLTPESRKSELHLRRTMLNAHLIGGVVTLTSMIAAVYYGQRVIDYNKMSDRNNHQLFVTTTIISYSATGLLAALSPPPMIRRDEVSTITTHKLLAWVHLTGMIVTPILGATIGRHMTRSQTARFHQASAYITTAALTASLIVITF